MNGINDQVARIEEKLLQLLKQYSIVQKENGQLQKETKRLKEQLDNATAEKNQLKQQADAGIINGEGMEKNSKKELENRINVYLKNIDKCLSLLHS